LTVNSRTRLGCISTRPSSAFWAFDFSEAEVLASLLSLLEAVSVLSSPVMLFATLAGSVGFCEVTTTVFGNPSFWFVTNLKNPYLSGKLMLAL